MRLYINYRFSYNDEKMQKKIAGKEECPYISGFYFLFDRNHLDRKLLEQSGIASEELDAVFKGERPALFYVDAEDVDYGCTQDPERPECFEGEMRWKGVCLEAEYAEDIEMFRHAKVEEVVLELFNEESPPPNEFVIESMRFYSHSDEKFEYEGPINVSDQWQEEDVCQFSGKEKSDVS